MPAYKEITEKHSDNDWGARLKSHEMGIAAVLGGIMAMAMWWFMSANPLLCFFAGFGVAFTGHELGHWVSGIFIWLNEKLTQKVSPEHPGPSVSLKELLWTFPFSRTGEGIDQWVRWLEARVGQQ